VVVLCGGKLGLGGLFVAAIFSIDRRISKVFWFLLFLGVSGINFYSEKARLFGL
jgi:hypothetical protein